MAKLRVCYQNPVTDAGLWEASMGAYWEICSPLDAWAIRRTFAVAPKLYQKWMPSAGQLFDLIEAFILGGEPCEVRLNELGMPCIWKTDTTGRVIATTYVDEFGKVQKTPPYLLNNFTEKRMLREQAEKGNLLDETKNV